MSRALTTYRLQPDAPPGDTSPLAFDTGHTADYAGMVAELTAPAALAGIRAVADETRAETLAECRALAHAGRTRDAVALAASTGHDIKTVQRWALVDRQTAMRMWPSDVPCHGWRRRYLSKATAPAK